MSRKVIILAAHDDGAGAHVTMCHVRNGLAKALEKSSRNCFIVYLSSNVYNREFARSLWGIDGRWKFLDSLDQELEDLLLTPPYQDARGVWIRTDNILQFAKNPHDGSLDVAKTRELIGRAQTLYDNWAFEIGRINPDIVALTVEMGVAQLSTWAKKNNIPAVSVGDTFWSRTLMGSLQGAGEFDSEMERVLYDIQLHERASSEVWLLPIVAPRDYADYLAEARIPYHYLPGFLGSRPTRSQVSEAKRTLAMKARKLVVLSSGMTGVWKRIYSLVCEKVKEERGTIDFAVLCPDENTKKWVLVEDGNERLIDPPSSLVAFFANAQLGVTRRGVTTMEFISANIPFIIVQEPNHWLSQRQQAAATEAGLCHSASLSLLLDRSKVIEILSRCLQSSQNGKMIARQRWFEFNMEDKLATHWIKYYAKWEA